MIWKGFKLQGPGNLSMYDDLSEDQKMVLVASVQS